MGFFKDLKEDFSQALNELIPEEEILEEDFSDDITDEWVNQETKENKEVEKKVNKKEKEAHKENEKNAKDLQDILEEEVQAAIDALTIGEESPEPVIDNKSEKVQDDNGSDLERLDANSLDEEDGLSEEELIQRMIDEDEKVLLEEMIEKEKLKEEKLEKNKIEQEMVEQEMEELKMEEQLEKEGMEIGDDSSDMELIAKLLGEDGDMDSELEVDESILTDTNESDIAAEEGAQPSERDEMEVQRILGDDVTVITKGTKINGSISSDGSLEIMGTINGDIDCLGKLSIVGNINGNSQASEIYVNTARLDGNLVSSGSIKVGVGTIVVGDMKASSAVIAGAVKGEVDVNGPVIIDSTAIVKGNINAKSVQINNGAVVDGYCSLSYASVDIDNFFDGEK
ncbi:MAG: polymer-forming cytoskeletal protein [Velocimicrobium sp.]